jgi:hypothetical protein
LASTPAILEIAHQFLLFGVHRNHWLLASDVLLNPGVDVFKLRVAVRMVIPFFRLPVGLNILKWKCYFLTLP